MVFLAYMLSHDNACNVAGVAWHFGVRDIFVNQFLRIPRGRISNLSSIILFSISGEVFVS